MTDHNINTPRDSRIVTAQELATDPQLNADFWRAVFARSAPIKIGGPFRRATWDEPFDYFASDHRRNRAAD